jgi:hypothetical protein
MRLMLTNKNLPAKPRYAVGQERSRGNGCDSKNYTISVLNNVFAR